MDAATLEAFVQIGTVLGIPAVLVALIQYARNNKKDSLDAAMQLLEAERLEKTQLKKEIAKLQSTVDALRGEVAALHRQLAQMGASAAYFVEKDMARHESE